MGGKPVTSENVPSIDNLRAYSPQISVDSRRQPTAAGHPTSNFYDDLVTVAMPDRYLSRWMRPVGVKRLL